MVARSESVAPAGEDQAGAIPSLMKGVQGRIKGAAIREFFEWYRGEVGHAELAKRMRGCPLLGSLSTFDIAVYGCGILPSGWYAASDVHVALDAIAHGLTDSEIEHLVTEGTRVALSRTLTGLHRGVMRIVGSPEMHARFAQRLWSTHYDTGKVESTRTGQHEQLVRYTQWSSHHPLLCKMTSVSDEVIFPLMGLDGVVVTQRECISWNDAACSHSVSWDRS